MRYLDALYNCRLRQIKMTLHDIVPIASCLIYARALLDYVNLIVLVRSVNKMLPSVKFAEYKVLTFIILRELKNAKIVQL